MIFKVLITTGLSTFFLEKGRYEKIVNQNTKNKSVDTKTNIMPHESSIKK